MSNLIHRPVFQQPSSQTLATNKSGKDEDDEKGVSYELSGAHNFLNDTKTAATENDLEEIRDAALGLDIERARAILEEAVSINELDPNYPRELLDHVHEALESDEKDPIKLKILVEEIKIEAALIDDSPYPEVRAVVSNKDNPEELCNTFRAWFIGLFFVIVATGITTYFTPRYPGIGWYPPATQVMAYPLGKAFEMFPSHWKFLNPGKFSRKEHMLITIMANVGYGGAYITSVVFALRMPSFYNNQELGKSAGFQIMLALSTQCMGFALAGLFRPFLVYPPLMIWQENLAQIALNSSFHSEKNVVANGWRISRYKFFLIVFTAYFCWYPISNFAFQAITYFNWPTWIKPDSVNLATWMGSAAGFGLNPIPSLDWAWLTLNTDPTITPLWSTLNQCIGMWFWGIPVIAGIWYSNTWLTGYLPMLSPGVFDRFGQSYNASAIMTNNQFDQTLYEAYSPAYISAGTAVSYAAFFAMYTAAIVHAGLYSHKTIRKVFSAWRNRVDTRGIYYDVHNRLMSNYKEAPEWWYGIVLVVTLVLGIVTAEHYETGLPVWAIFFCLIFSFFVVIPTGFLLAIANVGIGFNVLGELIAGYAIPGKPLANMMFKAFAVEAPWQAVWFSKDLKLGHYMKIPPRVTFMAQIVATILSCLVSLGITDWQIGHIQDMCTFANSDKFYCLGENAFFTSSVVWGLIGPKRNFSHGGLYYPLVYGFLAGAIIPIIPWFLARRFPRSFWKYVHIPASFQLLYYITPYGGSFAVGALWLGLLVQGLLKRRYLAWWMKYNYVGTSALNAALCLGAFFWYFTLVYHDKTPQWWGNTVFITECDFAGGCPQKQIPQDTGFFGPATGWH